MAENMDQKKALGRGLGSLIQGGSRSQVAGQKILELGLDDIIPNPNQPRKLFAKDGIDELAASIEEKGIIQPLVVRSIGGGKYELIAGERRYRASRQIQLERVPVVVKDINDQEVLELALIENVQREDLNPIEEALAYRELLSKFQYTQDELAKRIGKDRSSIANALRLLKLPDTIRNYLINSEISMGHARALLAVDEKDLQLKIARDIIDNHLSVRETESLIKKMKDSVLRDIERAAAVSAKPELPATLYKMENQLKKHLKTMIRFKGDQKQGKLSINYTSKEQLEVIVGRLLSGEE
jgi:ParB family chromosome partitioning protein